MVKKVIFFHVIIFFIFSVKTSFAQKPADSSLSFIQAKLTEAKSYMVSNRIKGEALAMEVYDLAKNNPAAIVPFTDVHNLIAIFKMNGEKYREAEEWINTGLQLAVANNQPAIATKLKSNRGLLYFRTGAYQKCISTSLDLLPNSPPAVKAGLLGNIAASYNYLNQYDLSIKYQLEAMELFRAANNKSGLANGNNLLGVAYQKLGKPQIAIQYLKESLSQKQELEDSLGMGNSLINLGENSFLIGDYTGALQYIKQAEAIFKALNNQQGLSKVYTNLGALAAKQRNFDEAKKQELKALQIAEKTNDSHVLNELYTNLGKTMDSTGNKDAALAFKDKALLEKDSLINLAVQKQIAEMQTKYETAKKEQLIKEQQFNITKRNYIIGGIVGFLLLGTLLGWLFFNRFRLKKQNELQVRLNEQQQKATIDILTAEEKERKRIASDLHDGVGQLMTAAWLNIQAVIAKKQNLDTETSELLQKTMHLVDESCKEVRAVSHNMMPNALLKKGLVNAVREFLQQINTKSTKINLQTDNLQKPLPTHVETVLYRVIQESVNNVIKHAQASSLDISIQQDNEGVDVLIEDNGKGFNFEEAGKKDGIGLQNIKSRIEYLNGTVEWDTAAKKGTVVAIHIPQTTS